MGYAKERKKLQKRKKKILIVCIFVMIFLLVSLLTLHAYVPAETWKYYMRLPKAGVRGEGEMRIHFVDVGQGDATIVELPDGKIMLIDGGDGSAASNKALMRHLNALRVKTVHYLFVTHADLDHIGGLISVVRYKNVERVFLPLVSETETQEYAALYAQMVQSGCTLETASPTAKLSLAGESGYTLQILYPYAAMVEGEVSPPTESNEKSVVVWLDYQDVSALFTGDAPIQTEEELMRSDKGELFKRYDVELSSTEILKVSHHGSDTATSQEFVEYLNVETAVISCGENNAYGHPTADVCKTLTDANAQVFRTDEKGSVVITVSNSGEYQTKTLGK